MIGETANPSFAYLIAGPNRVSNGRSPNLSESVSQLETAPGTVTLSHPRKGIVLKFANRS